MEVILKKCETQGDYTRFMWKFDPSFVEFGLDPKLM